MKTPDNNLTKYFEELVTKLWTSEVRAFAPRELKYAIGQENERFQGYRQQDSSELIQTVLSKIADDLNRVKADKEGDMPYFMNPEDHVMSHIKEEYQIKLFQDLNLMHEKSIIQELFNTQFLSTMTC